MLIKDTPFIVVDLETTGLNPNLDSIVEIAAVKVINGQIVEEKTQLLNPHIFVPQETTDITGITTEMLQGAPEFFEVAQGFIDFFTPEGVFTAHNAEFDFGFFNSHLRRADKGELKSPWLCTLKCAKTVHPNLQKYALGHLAETFKIDLPRAHRAIHDARATAELLIQFLEILRNGGARELKDIPGMQNLPKVQVSVSQGQGSLF